MRNEEKLSFSTRDTEFLHEAFDIFHGILFTQVLNRNIDSKTKTKSM